MLRLFLLRHAKSSWDNPRQSDFDRPLNERGRRAVPLVGRYMARENLFPDRILCSSAQRTRETLAGLLGYLKTQGDVSITDRLYHEAEDSYLPLIRSMAGTARTLLVIGHNPATQDTALEIVGQGDQSLRAAIDEKYPTAALSVITIDIDDWLMMNPGSGTLERFVRPRDLEDSDSDGRRL